MEEPSFAPSSATSAQGRSRWFLIAALSLVALVLASAAAFLWTRTLPDRVDKQQTVIVGQDQLAPGARSGLRILVRRANSEEPIPGAEIQAVLGSQSNPAYRQVVYTGKSDALGTADVGFAVPDDLPEDAELAVETRSQVGADRIVRPVKPVRPYRLYLTTDKPVYQPGQVIHLRVLALSAVDMLPAVGAEVSLAIEDARGNVVFRTTLPASEWGIASADFLLADEVNQGTYTIAAEIGETRSEKTVTVKWYVLPKFKVEIETDRPFYLPGETIQGHVQAGYFFGKPVAGGQVTIQGTTSDVERRQVAEVRGETDEAGGFDFAIETPPYLTSGAPEAGTAAYSLEVQVVDRAGHAEATTHDLPIAEEAILLDVVPESGQLRPGVENIVYILASYPDGSPAPATLEVTTPEARQEVQADRLGIAEVRSAAPGVIEVSARDAAGRTGRTSFNPEAESSEIGVLLRPDRPAYLAGDTMHLEAFTCGGPRTVYLDGIRERQTLFMHAADAESGVAAFDVDVSPDLAGTLELHAYVVLSDGSIVRDSRIVVINPANEIEVSMEADRESYRPGEAARLAFQLSRQGQPVPGALGIGIVDESVFSVEEQDPGLARLYFLLEAELLEPRYQIKDTLEPILLAPLPEPGQPAEAIAPGQLASAQAALAIAPVAEFAWRINSHVEKLDAAAKQQQHGFYGIGTAVAAVLAALPLAILAVVLVTLRRRQLLGKVVLAFWITVGILILLSLIVLPGIGIVVYFAYDLLGVGATILFGSAWLACLAILGIDAWRRGDEPALFVALALLAWALLFTLMVFAALQAKQVNVAILVGMILCALAGLAGVYLLGLGLRQQGAQHGSGAGIALAALALPTFMLVTLTGAAPVWGLAAVMQSPAIAYAMPASLLMGCAPAPLPQTLPGLMGAPAAAPTAAPAASEGKEGVAEAAEAAQPPRLRQYFPETLFWEPQAVTDEAGRLEMEIPMADSITTWRLSAQASTARGELGGLTAGLRVFQDFFVDLDLPVALTQGDEISVPVSVFNYLPEPQEVRLELKQEPWFELLDEPSKTLTIGANDVTAVHFRIRAMEFGRRRLEVTAWGEVQSDAIAREVRVVPDGVEIRKSDSNWLKDGTRGTVRIPQNAITGTPRIEVKVYPGVFRAIQFSAKMPSRARALQGRAA
jgi:hypothetical protein